MMVKLLVLQGWYGLSDPELERQVDDRLSFQRFLGFPESIPDATTAWLFRERLAETGRDRLVWEELQRQLDGKGLKVRKGVVQDAQRLQHDHEARGEGPPTGHKGQAEEQADKPEEGSR